MRTREEIEKMIAMVSDYKSAQEERMVEVVNDSRPRGLIDHSWVKNTLITLEREILDCEQHIKALKWVLNDE